MKCGSPADWHVRSDSGSGHVSQPHEAGSVTISGALPSCGFAASSARNFLRAVGGGAGVNDADRMPFSVRDRQVLGGLMRRSEVLQDEALMREARAMDAAQQKVEIEALHGGFGMDALGDFLVAKIVDRAAL